MSFGRREHYDRRVEPRSEVLERASVVFGDAGTKANGLIRNISLSGLKFVSERRLDLPRNVTLNFGNGETFACEVVREIDGKEFGLKFGDMSEFAESKIKADIDAVYQFTRSKSPMEICDTMEKVDFFGDQELEAAVRDYAAAYDRMIELYRERIFPHQRSGTVS
jgi:hypothetical protein